MSGDSAVGSAVATDGPESASTDVARPRQVPGWVVAVLALGVIVVHFRPWQGGLLEDWGLALAWENEGPGGLLARLPAVLGRPLHLVPHYLGMLLSDGGFVGPYAVLALVSVAQFVAASWALRMLVRSDLLRLALALAVGLHPWWFGGAILRFLPAQVAILGAVLWLGFALRFAHGGRVGSYVGLVLAPVVGLLAYQAPAGAIGLAAAVLALVGPGSARRRVAMFGSTVLAVGAVLAWSIVIAPAISPTSYEAQLAGAGLDLAVALRSIGRSVLRQAPVLLAMGAVLAMILVALATSGARRWRDSLILLGALALTPFTALIYAAQPLHLNDPERIAIPIGLALWLIAGVVAQVAPARLAPASLVALVAVVAFALAGAVSEYHVWTGYASEQQELINGITPVRDELGEADVLVVVDATGEFGDIYTLLPPYLNVAMDVQDGAGPDVLLCTPAATPRDHPVAARFPLATTPTCEELIGDAEVEPAGSVATDVGTVQLVVMAAADVAQLG